MWKENQIAEIRTFVTVNKMTSQGLEPIPIGQSSQVSEMRAHTLINSTIGVALIILLHISRVHGMPRKFVMLISKRVKSWWNYQVMHFRHAF